MRQVFVDALLAPGASTEISGDDYGHLTRSLRLKVGEALRVVDASFSPYLATLAAVDRRSAQLLVGEALPAEPAVAPLLLALCMPSAEAFDASLDAAVQLGATEIVPLHSARSRDQDGSKLPRWQRIAREACCQSLRARPPRIRAPLGLDDFLKASLPGGKFIAWQGSQEAPASLPAAGPLALLVGPEGGFEPAELELGIQLGWKAISLGRQILRVPVAVAAGLGILNHLRSGAGA